jgi:hypothetical protein
MCRIKKFQISLKKYIIEEQLKANIFRPLNDFFDQTSVKKMAFTQKQLSGVFFLHKIMWVDKFSRNFT